MKFSYSLMLILFVFGASSLIAQPNLETFKKNAKMAIPNWSPEFHCFLIDGKCMDPMDYNGDGQPEIISFTHKIGSSDIVLVAKNYTNPDSIWTFPLPSTIAEDLDYLAFLGFYDIDGDGNNEILIGRILPPFSQNGIDRGVIFIPAGGIIFEWDNKVIKDIRDWDNDGYVELVLQDNQSNNIEIWGQ